MKIIKNFNLLEFLIEGILFKWNIASLILYIYGNYKISYKRIIQNSNLLIKFDLIIFRLFKGLMQKIILKISKY